MPDERTASETAELPLDERFVFAILEAIDVTEDEAWDAVRTLLPLVRVYAHSEYDRGYEYGEVTACKRIADRMGLRLTVEKGVADA